MNKYLFLFVLIIGFSVQSKPKKRRISKKRRAKRIERVAKKKKVDNTLNLIKGIRGQALQKLLKLERKFRGKTTKENGELHGSILVRIAELYYEKAKDMEEREIKTFDAKMNAYHKNRKGPPPVLSTVRSHNLVNESIQRYQMILKKYPKHKMLDKVLFNLAFNYKETGRKKESIRYFKKMTKERPYSQLMPDAHLNIAEYYFEKNKWKKASKNYRKSAKFKNAKSYAFAIYKLGWTYYNLQNTNEAIHQLERVVKFGRSKRNLRSGSTQTGVGLIREALKDIVTFYSERKNTSNSLKFFHRIGGKGEYIWMSERLGKIQRHNGQHKKAVKTYRGLIGINENGARNPEWVIAIIDSYADKSDFTRMLRTFDELINKYNKKDSDWVVANFKNKKFLKENYKNTESVLKKYIEKHHKLAIKNNRKKHFRIARGLYKTYLKYFNRDKNSYKVRFFYAEMLFAFKNFIESAKQYSTVRDDMRSKKFREKSAFNTIHALEQMIQGWKEKISKYRSNSFETKKKIKRIEKNQIIACDQYILKVPKGKDLIDVKFRAARLFYKHKDYVEARKRFSHVAEKYPKNKNTSFAVHLMLDTFNIENDWMNLNKWARRFKANKILAARDKGKLGKELHDIIIDSQFKLCLDLEKGKKYKDAGDQFKAFAVEFPDRKLAKDAYLNAARNYENADRMILAIEMHKKYLELYPKGSKVKYAIKSIAVNYEKAGYVTPSAKYYRIFVARYPKDKDAEKAHYNIAYYSDLSGKVKEAEKEYIQFIKNYPKSKFAPEAIYYLAELYRERGDSINERRYLDLYSKARSKDADKVLMTKLTLGKYLLADNELVRARRYFKSTIKYYWDHKRSKFLIIGERYAGEAQFLLADLYYNKFNAIKLQLPKEKMIKNISKKMKAMQRMNQEFSKVFNYGQTEFALAALYKIGMSYEDFSKSLFTAPMPTNMTTEEIRAFKAELESAAFPLEEEAMGAFEKNIEKASDLKIGEKWARLSYEKMHKYKPKDFPLDMFEEEDGYIESATAYKVD